MTSFNTFAHSATTICRRRAAQHCAMTTKLRTFLDELPVDVLNELAEVASTNDLKALRLTSRSLNARISHQYFRQVSSTWSKTLSEDCISMLKELVCARNAAERMTSLTTTPADVGVTWELWYSQVSKVIGDDSEATQNDANALNAVQDKDERTRKLYEQEISNLFTSLAGLPDMRP